MAPLTNRGRDGQNYVNNLLYNGNFMISQRGQSFSAPNDDTYIMDRWLNLQESDGDWNFSTNAENPVSWEIIDTTQGYQPFLTATNVTANSQCAIVQILELKDIQQISNLVNNQKVSLSFWAKTTGTDIANLRVAILTWAGTADSVTSDVIATWAQGGVDPTWATSWVASEVSSVLPMGTSWQKFNIENVDLGGLNNLAVVIWVDDGTITAGDDFSVGMVKLEAGSVCTPWNQRIYAEELALCQRYCKVLTTDVANEQVMFGFSDGVNGGSVYRELGSPMRIAPTLSLLGVADTDYTCVTKTLASVSGCSYSSTNRSKDVMRLNITKTAAFTAGDPFALRLITTTGKVIADAEL